MKTKPTIVLIGAEKDRPWMERLKIHLDGPRRLDLLNTWDEGQINAGDALSDSVYSVLTLAHAAVFLISPDFIASERIINEVVPRLMGNPKRIPIFAIRVRPCLENPIFSDCKFLLQSTHFLTQIDEAAQEVELRDFIAALLVQLGISWTPQEDQELTNLLALAKLYRDSTLKRFQSWRHDPWLSKHSDTTQQRTVPFEKVFYPIRLCMANGAQPEEAMDVFSILKPGGRLIVLASGGMGKTTWLQWMFRKLVQNQDMLPVLLELPKVACSQGSRTGQDPSFFVEIQALGQYYGIDNWKANWSTLFNHQRAPIPVLLLDGWDETGSMGTIIKDALNSFLERHPRVAVVVTSRYYGVGLPSHLENFVTWSLQPFSEKDVLAFSRQYLLEFHQDSDSLPASSVEEFAQSLLSSAPGVRELARSPLLLTLMLHNFRDLALPSKQHVLYEQCIRILLDARPEQKTKQGGRLPENCYRPDDPQERMSIAAILAAKMIDRPQAGGYTWDELERMLPEGWPASVLAGQACTARGHDFLVWMAGPAGILVEDGSTRRLSFVNECLQEYLAARYLNEVTEDANRVAMFIERAKELRYWEVLMLWAAFMQSTDSIRNAKRLPQVLDALHARGSVERHLEGALLATGAGDEAAFEQWLDGFPQLAGMLPKDPLEEGMQLFMEMKSMPGAQALGAAAWVVSLQQTRRQAMAVRLTQQATNANIIEQIDLLRIARRYGLEMKVPPINKKTVAGELLSKFFVPRFDQANARSIAIGRLLGNFAPESLVEPHSTSIIPLLLWPSQRCLVGQLLQCAAILGARRADLHSLATNLLRPISKDEDWLADRHNNLATIRASRKRHERPDDEIFSTALDGFEAVYSKFNSDIKTALTLYLKTRLKSNTENGISTAFIRLVMGSMQASFSAVNHYLERGERAERAFKEVLSETVLNYILGWLFGLAPETPWLWSFAKANALIIGGTSTMRLLMNLQSGPLAFFIPAYRAYLLPSDSTSRKQLVQALSTVDKSCHPLYPALARHIAGLSTHADRELLLALCDRRESCTEPLSLMLGAIVRGELETDEGPLTLDQLSKDCNFAPLPYLDEPPPNIEISPAELQKHISRLKTNEAVRARDWTALWREFRSRVANSTSGKLQGV